MPLNQGFVLSNRYRIVQMLGKGGFGAVYRGWDINLQLRVAIKENTDTSDEGKQQFFREAQMLAMLNHSNLPRVTDHFFLPNQGQYLVMDFIDGEDLDALLTKQGPVSEAALLPWIGQIIDALHYLHSQPTPIIHRDVKPANIRITPQGKAVLVDFGIAKLYGSGTVTSARAVTAGFSPPEQYMMTGTTPRSDIYALGATMYSLLTGQTLATGPQPAPVQPISTIQPAVSQRLSWVIMKALAPDPKDRFGSVLEIKKALGMPMAPGQNIPLVQQAGGAAGGTPVSTQVFTQNPPIAQPNRAQPIAQPPAPQAARRGRSGMVGALIAVIALLCLGTLVGGFFAYRALTGAAEPTAVAGEKETAGEEKTVAERSPAAPEGKTRTPAAGPTKTAAPTGEPAAEEPAAEEPAAKEPTPTSAPAAGPAGAALPVEIKTEAGQSGIRLELRSAENQPIQGVYIEIAHQDKDLNGNPIDGDRAQSGSTDETGSYTADLDPGVYTIRLPGEAGYLLDPHFNYTVSAGKRAVVRVTLGAIRIGVMRADGTPVEGVWNAISFQETDVSGNPAIGERFRSGYTDNRGIMQYGLYPGTYVVQINDLRGMPWGSETGHIVEAGKITSIVVQLSRLDVGVMDADGKPIEGVYLQVLEQTQDIQGNPALGQRFDTAYTDNTGVAGWNMTAGTYALSISGIEGYAWDNIYNHVLESGKSEKAILQLGRMMVTAKDGSGSPLEGVYIHVYTQKSDVNGNAVPADRITTGYTDNTGSKNFNLTPGSYSIKINDQTLTNVLVEPGKTIITDGSTTWAP